MDDRPNQPQPDQPEVTREVLDMQAQLAGGYPLTRDSTPFGRWLLAQTRRKDRVGMLARVAAQDPYWPGGKDRRTVAEYFRRMGARDYVMQSVRAAWDEFEKIEKRERIRAKNRMAKESRRRNRGQKKRRRKN